MTLIKKITLKGFKSFAKPTEIVFGEGFNCCLGPNGSGKSSRWDTEVLLSSGEIKPIGEIVEESLKKSKVHVELDDGVYTPENPSNITTWGLDPKTMKVVSKNISAFIKRKGEPHLYTIKTRTGKEVTTTGCHPVMIYRNGEVKSEVVKNLRRGQLIATPNKLEFPELEIKVDIGDVAYEYVTNELARLLGYLIGDGCIVRNGERMDFVNADEELINDYLTILKSLGLKFGMSKRKNSKAITVYSYSKGFTKSLVKLFRNEYKKEGKHIPSQILFSKKEILSSFLAALFDCDASVRKDNPTFEYVTMSKRLADNVVLALLRFGIVARKTVKKKYATNTEKKIRKDYYCIMIEGKGKLTQLYKSIPLRCEHKKEELRKKAESSIIENPNIDIIPQEVNYLIKKCKETLCVPYKPLKKKYPFFSAYIENRCCPTKEGLRKTLSIFNKKLELFKEISKNLKLNQKILMNYIRKLNLSRAEAARFIGITIHAVTRYWDKDLFNARPKNLEKLYLFVKEEIENRIKKSSELIKVLENLSNSDIFWDQIISIEKVKGEPYVYDLTIPNCHNFIGNGIFVHNSNIMDMMCFVLGKISAKSLRAEKAANLIYNGGKKGTPAKDAECSIVFDNSNKKFPIESKELMITRKVKQSGNSVYRINNEVRTRQQVVDMLRAANIEPDGHNIILQGDIVRFMEMKPVERRELVEEIAGISVWEDKKQKALNELERVEERLKEASIMLAERERHLKELKKDRDQALKYKELEKNVKDNKATWLNIQIKEKETKKQEIESRLNKQKQELDRIKKRINELRQLTDKKKEEIIKLNEEMEAKGDEERRKLSNEMMSLKDTVARDEERLNTCRNEIQKLTERIQRLRKEMQENDKKIDELDLQKEGEKKKIKELTEEEQEIQSAINKFKAKHGIKDSNFDIRIDSIEKEIETKQEGLLKEQEGKQNLIAEKTQLEMQLKTADEKINEILNLKKEDQEKLNKLKNLRQEFSEVAKELSKKEEKNSKYNAELTNLRQKQTKIAEELAKLNIRQTSIKEFTAMDIATKKILELGKGIYGTVSDLGETNSKYSLALETAAGPRIKSVVVDHDETAAKCIRYLKENKLGVVTFLPLNKIKPTSNQRIKELTIKKGVIGLAVDLINYDPKFKNVFSYVFGNTLVVQDVNIARGIGIGSARMVTLEGDLMEQSGAMTGGYRRRRTGAFKEKELGMNITKLSQEETMLRKQLEELGQIKLDNENELWKLKERKALLEAGITNLERSTGFSGDIDEFKKNREELANKINNIIEQVRKAQSNINIHNEEMKELKQQRNQIREKLRQPEIAEELNKLDERKQKINLVLIETKAEIKGIDDMISAHYQEEKQKLQKIIEGHEKEQKNFEEEIKKLKEGLTVKKSALKSKENTQNKFFNEFKSLYAKRTKINEFMQRQENILIREGDKTREVEDKINRANIDRAKVEAELAGLQEDFKDYADAKIRRNIEVEQLIYEIRQFDRMMKDMGNVNLRALEVYEDINKQYKEILEKKDKLKTEKEDVLSMMQEIDSKKQYSFMKTFKVLQQNFEQCFSQLSTKGDAFLELENKRNVFEGGVDIKVRIVGNRFLDIKGLSGGEKSLAALAFIFAIQEFNPASFYLLDEVDAALDKRNSELLSGLIKKYSEKAQYIVISHNDHIITEADQIYGVSMQDGVSKIVSLRI